MADLVGAVRLPEGNMRATTGTDVAVDVLVFQRRAKDRPTGGPQWMDLVDIELESDADEGSASDPLPGPKSPTKGNRARPNDPPIEQMLDVALARLPRNIFTPSPQRPVAVEEDNESDETVRAGTAAEGATVKEGSYFVGQSGRLMQIVNGTAVPAAVRKGKGDEGMTPRVARIIRALIPIRDAVREVLPAQATDRSWAPAQVRLRVAYSGFTRYFGPINRTVVTVTTDPETGEERRRTGGPTSPRLPTTPIAGWSPASRNTSSRAGWRALARSSVNASFRPQRRRSSSRRPTRSQSPSTRPGASIPSASPNCSSANRRRHSHNSAPPSSAIRFRHTEVRILPPQPAYSGAFWRKVGDLCGHGFGGGLRHFDPSLTPPARRRVLSGRSSACRCGRRALRAPRSAGFRAN